MLGNIQRSLGTFLRVNVTFCVGIEASNEMMLREHILQLLEDAAEAQFYTKPGVLILLDRRHTLQRIYTLTIQLHSNSLYKLQSSRRQIK